jgi:cytochrome c oxidase subunit 2
MFGVHKIAKLARLLYNFIIKKMRKKNRKKISFLTKYSIVFLTIGILFPTFAECDVAAPWQIGFQDPATPIIIGIIKFHNHLIFILISIGTFVFWILLRAIILFIPNKHPATDFTHSTILEIVWTIVPAILLVFIAGPSFALLYSIEELINYEFNTKIIGHQWYWSYEYSSHIRRSTLEKLNFDSYIVKEEDLTFGALRLLEVDYRIKLPIGQHIRLLVTSSDVLHSWAVPALGIKIDACPGRLNQVSVYLLRKGVFYGQCSEICGINHGFIPIVVEGVSRKEYDAWVCRGLINQ